MCDARFIAKCIASDHCAWVWYMLVEPIERINLLHMMRREGWPSFCTGQFCGLASMLPRQWWLLVVLENPSSCSSHLDPFHFCPTFAIPAVFSLLHVGLDLVEQVAAALCM